MRGGGSNCSCNPSWSGAIHGYVVSGVGDSPSHQGDKHQHIHLAHLRPVTRPRCARRPEDARSHLALQSHQTLPSQKLRQHRSQSQDLCPPLRRRHTQIYLEPGASSTSVEMRALSARMCVLCAAATVCVGLQHSVVVKVLAVDEFDKHTDGGHAGVSAVVRNRVLIHGDDSRSRGSLENSVMRVLMPWPPAGEAGEQTKSCIHNDQDPRTRPTRNDRLVMHISDRRNTRGKVDRGKHVSYAG